MLHLDVKEYGFGKGQWFRTAGGITAFGGGGLPQAAYGDLVEFLGVLEPNSPPTNPGEPALNEVYERRGIYGVASGMETDGVLVLEKAPWYVSPVKMAEGLRGYMRGRLKSVGEGAEVHPLVEVLLLGDRHALPVELSDDLHDAGATHFLAISGLHVGIFAAGIWVILILSGMGVGKRHVMLIVLVWFYVFFTGSRISSIRAALMLSLLAGAPLLHRRPDALSTLAGTALLILIWRPQELFSAGFQLSFLAVWAIFYIYPLLRETMMPWRGPRERMQSEGSVTLAQSLWMYGSDYFCLSLSIWLVIVPLTAFHFNRYSLLLPFLNVALWPLVLFLILNCFTGIVAVPLGGFVFRIFNYFSSVLSGGIEGLLSIGRTLPGFVSYTPGPPLWWVYLYYAVVLFCVMLWRKRFRLWVVATGVGVLALSMLFYEIRASELEHFRMTIKDVGHGQSIMLRLPGGGVKLYDAGSTSYAMVRNVSGVLRHNRVRAIGALTVSHRHFDHYCFVPELAKQFGIDRLLIPPKGAGENAPHLVQRELRDASEHYVRVKEGASISAGGLKAEFLHPDLRFLAETSVRRNDLSAVLLCSYDGWRILLPGDAEEAALARLISDYGEKIRADVVVLPHHGAWTEGLAAFIEASGPAMVVASNGRPLDGRVKKLFAGSGISVWATFEDGAVTLDFGPDAIRVEGYVSGRTQLIPRRR